MRLLITGATGYIGRRLLAAARSAGCEVVAAVRKPGGFEASDGIDVRRFDLTRPDDADEVVASVDAVVHLGAIIGENSCPPGVAEDLNVSGTRALLEAARKRGVRRFVFLSSQSAAAEAPTRYGRSKWQIEQMLTHDGEVAVRTGMVCGGPPRGVYGQLVRLSRRLPWLPAVRAAAPLYPIHIDDLCAGLLALVLGEATPPRLARLAAPTATPFASFVRMLARNRAGRIVRMLPLPGAPVVAASRLSEAIPFLPTVSRERVLGLMALRPMEPGPALPDVAGVTLRNVEAALATEGLRRRLLLEGQTLMRYVLRRRPPDGALRRYVRAVVAENDSAPLDLSQAVQRFPCLLRAIEPVGRTGPERLRRRLVLAGRIVEMTTAAAPVFHNYDERPFVVSALALAWLVLIEAVGLPFRLIAAAFRTRR